MAVVQRAHGWDERQGAEATTQRVSCRLQRLDRANDFHALNLAS
jgi:hypothetical protein